MNRIHKPDLRPWISQPMCIKDFIAKWGFSDGSESDPIYHNSWIRSEDCNFHKASKKVRVQLEKDCDVSLLNCEDEEDYLGNEVWKTGRMAHNTHLQKLHRKRLHLKFITTSTSYRQKTFRMPRYRHSAIPIERMLKSLRDKKIRLTKKERESVTTKQTSDALLTVQVFRPASGYKTDLSRLQFLIPDQEFLVLASEGLVVVKDAICCLSDAANKSEPQSQESNKDLSNMFKSGFLFINDVFYNDNRLKDSKDYSE